MNSKGNANMWWIIIGAVIALVVMIILMVMFTGKTQPLEKGLSACESKGGACATNPYPCPDNTFEASTFSCKNQQDTCCIGSPKACTSGSCTAPHICGPYGTKMYCYTN